MEAIKHIAIDTTLIATVAALVIGHGLAGLLIWVGF